MSIAKSGLAPLAFLVTSLGAVAVAAAGATHFAPDEAVNIFNDTSETVAVAIDGRNVCEIEPFDGCTAMLAGAHDETPHAVFISQGDRSVSDQVSIADCHWNWNGAKTFTVTDERVHFECQENVTTAQFLEICRTDAERCNALVKEGASHALAEDDGYNRACYARYPDLTAPDRLPDLTAKITAELRKHPELSNGDALTSIDVEVPIVLACS